MNWYKVEYSGGKETESVMVGCEYDLEQVLNSIAPPKFIKFSHIAYYSKLTGKYQLYSKWETKYTDDVLVSTAAIISVRGIVANLLEGNFGGEVHALSQKDPFCILVPESFVQEHRKEIEEYLMPSVEKTFAEYNALPDYTLKKMKYKGQALLQEDEFVVAAHGEIIIRKQGCQDMMSDLLRTLTEYARKTRSTAHDDD